MRRKKNYEQMTKEEIFKAEKEKIQKITKKLDMDTQKLTESLVDEAAFMASSLYELRKIIDEKGYTEEYQNGVNQRGTKKASEVEIYNVMIKNYQNTIKQLTDLMNKNENGHREKNSADGDDFFEFILEKKR